MENVDDVDAWAGLAWRGVIVPGNVGSDDGGDDDACPGAHVITLPPGRRNEMD